MKFILHKQLPKPSKNGISGNLVVHDKVAWLFAENNDILATIKHPEIIYVGPDGMMIKGFEPNGYTSIGVEKFIYQEWLLKPKVNEKFNKE